MIGLPKQAEKKARKVEKQIFELVSIRPTTVMCSKLVDLNFYQTTTTWPQLFIIEIICRRQILIFFPPKKRLSFVLRRKEKSED